MSANRYDAVFYVPALTPLLTDRELLPPGGAETQIFLLTRALARHGARVCLVVFDAPGVEIPTSVDGVDVIVRPLYRAHQPLIGKIREAVRIHRTLTKIDAPVVVTRIAGPQVGLVGLSTKLRRRRFIYSSANISDFDFAPLAPKRRDLRLYELGVRLADSVVVQTEEQIAMCQLTFGKRPDLVKSISEEAPARERRPEAFLWIGRLVWYKQPLAFIELAKSLPNLAFKMVGVPSASDPQLADQVFIAAAAIPNLELLEPRTRPQLMELVDRAVAVVNTADFEGMPNIFLEGWSRGIPALALTHDPGGVIGAHGLGEFAHGSSVSMVSGAERLWRSRNERDALSATCRRYVSANHSAEVIAAQWLHILLAEHRSLATLVQPV